MKTMTNLTNRPAWIDLSTTDAAAARTFYEQLFGWKVDVSPDPQYGGYGMAERDNIGIAGIGPKMDPSAPTIWSLYIGTDDVDDLARRVEDAGGTVAWLRSTLAIRAGWPSYRTPPVPSSRRGRRRACAASSPRAERVRLGRAQCT